jgi:hypothetical protein
MPSKFIMITVAACDSAFMPKALEHVDALATDIRNKAGAAVVRYGVISTGNRAGSLVLFQGYEELNGIDRAFQVYTESSAYQALMGSGKLHVQMRNIWKIEALGLKNESPDAPKYGVMTRFASSDLMLERLQQFVPMFEDNGALFMRYGTLMTGGNAGQRLLGVAYPSMAAIEKTYDALGASDAYRALLGDVELGMRNIFRFIG